jgi:outer membrane receptor for ferrienterochelin and colicin
MISTEYYLNGDFLQYKNYNKVLINGINLHYYRKITEKLKLKFVYNLTDASSDSDEILEGISKHSFRLNIYYQLLKKLNIVSNIKYAGKKFIYEQQEEYNDGSQSITIIDLSNYFISDLYVVSTFKNFSIKVGAKNILNYKDSRRFSSYNYDLLNNYDPGRRLFFELNIGFKDDYNND